MNSNIYSLFIACLKIALFQLIHIGDLKVYFNWYILVTSDNNLRRNFRASYYQSFPNLDNNKKVLLHERKRHIAAPPCSKCSGGGVPTLVGGTYLGVPLPHPDLAEGEGVPTLDGEYLPWGPPPHLPWGTPPPCPDLDSGEGVPILDQGGTYLGVPLPPGCEQTDTCENSTFPSYYVRGR